ncbi:hypothetical protein Q2374_27625, partial [Escherichia coli]|nr:hypothetical protein [Escherichia coli]
SSDRDITYQNQVFATVPGGITDNGIICSGDPQSDQFVITAPADLEVAAELVQPHRLPIRNRAFAAVKTHRHEPL